jgi:hypothetical protein
MADIQLLDMRVGCPDGMDTRPRQESKRVSLYRPTATFERHSTVAERCRPDGGDSFWAAAETEDSEPSPPICLALADQDGLGAPHFQWQRDAGGGIVDCRAPNAASLPRPAIADVRLRPSG